VVLLHDLGRLSGRGSGLDGRRSFVVGLGMLALLRVGP
jgi:hypothetical protein